MSTLKRDFRFSLITIFLAGSVFVCCKGVVAQTETPFHETAYLTVVDAIHDKLTGNASGTTYLIDTRKSQIHLLANLNGSPVIGDLVVGMRVDVTGDLQEGNIIRASEVQVLPYVPPGGAVPEPTVPASDDASDHKDVIHGRIISSATFFRRDIKVKSGNAEIAVTVPRGIPIKIGSKPVSVHDLKAGMPVNVAGAYDIDEDFEASSILVDPVPDTN